MSRFSVDHQKQPPGGVLWKKMFLEILENSQENICARVFFPVDFVKFLRIPFLQNTSEWLLLDRAKESSWIRMTRFMVFW